MPQKRALIETVNDELKNICQMEHTRHRSFDNFIASILSALVAYSSFEKKPSINLFEELIELKFDPRSNSRFLILLQSN